MLSTRPDRQKDHPHGVAEACDPCANQQETRGNRGSDLVQRDTVLAANDEQEIVADHFQSCRERVLATGKYTGICL